MRSPCLILAAFAAAVCSLPYSASAAPNSVTLSVKEDVTSSMIKPVPFVRNQQRALIITVSNTSREPLDLKVEYKVFGRDIISHEITVLDQGEHPLTIKPLGTEQFETTSAKTVATDTHYDIKTKTKVQGSGATIVGQGVQVLQGSTVVAESYEPPSMKEQWAKLGGAKPGVAGTPVPAAKK